VRPAATPAELAVRASSPSDRWFYTSMAALLAAIIVVGFWPTFFGRDPDLAGALPRLLLAHGLFASAWLVLFNVQAWLIGARAPGAHRRVGVAGMALVVGMLAIGALVIAHLELSHGRESFEVLSAHVFANAAPLSAFGLLALAGVWQRKTAARHKRLMLLATVVLTPAALGRWLAGLGLETLNLPVYAALAFANAVYDRWTYGRAHAIALWGALALVTLDLTTSVWLEAVGG
jgi:hypothetical protein